MAWEEPPHRHNLTPIGDELELRSHPVEPAGPSLLDRLRRLRRPRRVPTTWYGAVVLGLLRFTRATVVVVGLTYLVAYLAGWNHGRTLAKTFYFAGAFLMGGAVLASASPMGAPYQSQRERLQSRTSVMFLIPVGFILILIGVVLDTAH